MSSTPTPRVFSADSTALVGNKFGAPIGPDLKIEGNPFNGTIKGVQIDLKLTDKDHYVSDDERWRVADGDSVASADMGAGSLPLAPAPGRRLRNVGAVPVTNPPMTDDDAAVVIGVVSLVALLLLP